MKVKHKKRAKGLTAAAVTVLTAVVLMGCADENEEKQLAYRQTGIECMTSGDYEGALAAFDTALSYCKGTISSIETDICSYKAAAQYASGDVEGALKTYDALINYDSKAADAYYIRGCLLLEKGEADKALEDFSHAVSYHADDYELYIRIYQQLAAHNLQEQGENYINQAFDIKGNDAEHSTYRGKLYLLLGEYENVKEELNVALKKGSSSANLVMAQLLEAQGDNVGAETYYQAYVDSGASDSEAMNALAKLAIAKGEYTQALSYVNEGLAMDNITNRRELMQNQVLCLEYTSDFTGAWQAAQEYVLLYPNDLEMQREYIFLKNRQVSVESEDAVQAEIQTDEALEAVDDTEFLDASKTEGTEADRKEMDAAESTESAEDVQRNE